MKRYFSAKSRKFFKMCYQIFSGVFLIYIKKSLKIVSHRASFRRSRENVSLIELQLQATEFVPRLAQFPITLAHRSLWRKCGESYQFIKLYVELLLKRKKIQTRSLKWNFRIGTVIFSSWLFFNSQWDLIVSRTQERLQPQWLSTRVAKGLK